MKTLSLFLANLFLIATVTLYFRNVLKAGVTPNPITFFVRSVVATMNCFSYLAVVQYDYFKLSITVVSAAGLVIIFVFALFRGSLTKLRTVDVVCGSATLIIGVIWKTTGDPILANLLLQIIMLFAFYPAISGILAGAAREKALPWILATLCYAFMIVAIVADWNANGWYALVHPIVSGVIGNGSLALAVLWTKGRFITKAV